MIGGLGALMIQASSTRRSAIAREVFQRGADPQRPGFVEARIKDSEGGFVVACDDDKSVVRVSTYCGISASIARARSMNALAAAERKEVPGVTPHADKYCVCDPGPVTPDCKAPQLDHWRLGQWLDVDSGVNSENDVANDRFALGQHRQAK